MKKHVSIGSPRRLSLLLLLAAMGFAAGCGGGSGGAGVVANEVTGKVTLGDKNVSGSVVFVYADKEVANPIGPDGSYNMPNAQPGQTKVYIKAGQALVTPGGKGGPEMPAPVGGVGGGAGVPPPAKYTSANTSGLSFEVKTGKQTYDIPLTK